MLRTLKLHCLSTALLLVAALLAPTLAQARDYIVEVVIFENRFGSPIGGSLAYPKIVQGMYLNGDTAASAGFRPIENGLTLSAEADAMASSGRYRVLAHLAWQQPGLNDREAKAIRISIGRAIPLYIPEDLGPYTDFLPARAAPEPGFTRSLNSTLVNGTLKVRLGRFLHMDALLVYTDSETGQSYRLSQSRRMRSRELHYIDNPKFGILTRILPVEESGEQSPVEAEEETPDEESPATDTTTQEADATETNDTETTGSDEVTN